LFSIEYLHCIPQMTAVPDNLEVRFSRQQSDQAFAEQGVVVNHQQADFRARAAFRCLAPGLLVNLIHDSPETMYAPPNHGPGPA
jgi:hypothetical protein